MSGNEQKDDSTSVSRDFRHKIAMPQSKRTEEQESLERRNHQKKKGGISFSQFGIHFLKRILEINSEIASMDRNSKGMVNVS